MLTTTDVGHFCQLFLGFIACAVCQFAPPRPCGGAEVVTCFQLCKTRALWWLYGALEVTRLFFAA